jgi:cell wall-associated NlpC family hydrolase
VTIAIEAEQRARVVAAARSWIGTPYVDGGEIKGRNGAIDCARLVKQVFVEAGLVDDFAVAPVVPQWSLHRGEERFIAAVCRCGGRQHAGPPQPGDVVIYRVGRCYAHGGVVVGWPTIVHATAATRVVVEADGLGGGLAKPERRPIFFSFW